MKKYILLVLVISSTAFLSFRDNPVPKYTDYNQRVIKRFDGALYQKGKVNLKFKEQIYGFTGQSFGLSQLDGFLSQYNITKVCQQFPLKKDVSKRVIGDEDLAKMFQIDYNYNIDPTELSEFIKAQFGNLIEWVEPEFVYEADFIPNDPQVAGQYHISKINCYQAWDLCKGDTNVVIGICDSGSDLDHPDLAANIKINYADPINNIDDDNNGYIDDYWGWDFYYNDNDPNIQGSGNPHGSYVSGDASQVTNNGIHGAGVGFKVKLRISKHTDDITPDGLLYNTNSGLVYLYQNGSKIINCSWGSSSPSAQTQNIVNDAWNAGTIVVASAGNGNPGTETIRYPAAYNHVICVAATNSTDLKAGFSNYHDTVDVSAPGDAIVSTAYNNTYATVSGTSMSSPITAGTIGLIRSFYPSITPAEIETRLELGVDSIYNLNPGYIGKLGSGRINAFKCLANKPIISILSVSHNDSLYGNNDRIYDIDEKVSILLTYKNIHIAGNNVSLRLTTTDPAVTITKDSIFVGNLAAYGTYNTTYANTFEVKANSTCPFDKMVTFKLASSQSAYANDPTGSFTITFRQGWATHTINRLKLSLTRDGAVGKKTQAYGGGLILTNNPSMNNILEGGLMIGISNTKVSDVCRRGSSPTNISDTDFTSLSLYNMYTPGSVSSQDGRGRFNDDGAGTDKIGVTVNATSYAWNTPQDTSYIILRYMIRNTSGAAINNMYAAIYMYYTPSGNTSNNVTALDTANKLGYTFNNNTTNPYLGVAILSSQNLNFKPYNAAEVLNGFTHQEKWDGMSNGIVAGSLGPGLNCFVVSAGPINLNNGDSTAVGFVIVKGTDLAELKNNTITARNRYAVIGIEKISSEIPLTYSLYQNYPNPFNPYTTIKFDIPKNDFVNIAVYNITGQLVATLADQQVQAGRYEIKFNASDFASGVYFYRIITSNFTDVKKMVILK